MKPELMNVSGNMPCQNCGKNDYTTRMQRDADGYQRVMCKNCNFVIMKISDNGTSMDIQIADRRKSAEGRQPLSVSQR